MRYWLGIGAACLILLGGAVSCSGPGVEQVQAVPQANDYCTHYVDSQASTDGDGSLDMPWNNIAGHADDLEAGDVMCVRGDPSTPDRVYTETVISPGNNTGTPSGTQVRAVPQANDDCTHYVDNQAPADGDGSLDAPWSSIAQHVGDLEAGDVMCVRGDPSVRGRVYTEPTISLNKKTGTPSGTEEAPIVVRTYPGEHVVLHTTGGNILDLIQVEHWQFDGFVFDKEFEGGYAVHFRWANLNVLRNCEIHNGSGEGIHFNYGEYNVIENCRIHGFDAGPYKDAHGILIAGGKDNVIRGNEIYDCTGDGIQFYPYSGLSGTIVEDNHFYTTLGSCSENAIDVKVGSPIIRGNVMHGFRPCDGSCGGSGGTIGAAIAIHPGVASVLVVGNEIYDSGAGVLMNASNVQVINNLIHDIVTDAGAWTNTGIYVHTGVAVDIFNNTFVDLPREALRIGEHCLDVEVRNNLFYSTGRSFCEGDGTGATVDYNGWFSAAERIEGPHEVVGDDPLFVSPDDYHLRAISPAVDAGDNAGAPTHDLDGSPRPYGPAVDLGAFEVQEPLPVTTLKVSEGMTTTNSVTVTLIWIEPGQVGQSSTAHHSELRYDTQVITQEDWDQATVVEANISARQPGDVQRTIASLPWSGSGHLYFALRVFDVDNIGSEVSNPAFWPFESVFLPFVTATATFSRTIKWGLIRAQAQTSVVQNSPCEDVK